MKELLRNHYGKLLVVAALLTYFAYGMIFGIGG